MTLFKSHAVFGLVLLIIGFVFDFLFVEGRISAAFKTDPVSYLGSWEKQLYDLTKFYIIILGFTNVALALLISHFTSSTKIDWTVFGLMVIGSILLISTGFWYAVAGPSFTWEARCTVLTIGLFAVVLSLGSEVYNLLSRKVI